MIDPKQLRDYILIPVLNDLGLNSTAAVELMLGTAMQESGLVAVHQYGGGPALGLWQIEPATVQDLLSNFILYKPKLQDVINRLAFDGRDMIEQIPGNLYYAAAMSRIFYYRVPAALPAAGDIQGQAAYYKRYYNTPAGAATVEQYIANWNKLKPLL